MSAPSEYRIVRWDHQVVSEFTDDLAAEEPLEIRVRGRAIGVTMRTPGHDVELVAGFLLTEGVVHHRHDLLRIEHCARNQDDNVALAILAPEVTVDFDRLTRHVFASSSCGLCGKTTIDAVRSALPPIAEADMLIRPAVLVALPDAMRAAQAAFARTGGMHAAALFTTDGELLVLREDVGRHNAVDKVIGHALLAGLRTDRHVLLISGRASFEILQKALAAGIPVVAAVSAPSSLAVEFARSSNQTLIGFLRGARMNVYAGQHRVVGLTARPDAITAEPAASLVQPPA